MAMGNALVISSRVRSQLARMASHELLFSYEILEAVEDDDAETLGALVSDVISELDGR